MKKIQTTCFIILLLISGSALAGTWMIGGSLGMAWGDADAASLNSELNNRNINAAISKVESSRSVVELFAGYEFLPRWGVELAYVDLGDVKATINGTIAGVNDYFASGRDVYPQTATGWQLSGVYRYPLTGMLQLTARMGVYSWTSDYTLLAGTSSQDVSQEGTDISYGVGFETGRWIQQGGIVGQFYWERYSINSEAIDVLSLGVSYRF